METTAQIFENGLSTSYANGKEAGILEAQIIMLQIMNENLLQLTASQLIDEFQKRTNKLLEK